MNEQKCATHYQQTKTKNNRANLKPRKSFEAFHRITFDRLCEAGKLPFLELIVSNSRWPHLQQDADYNQCRTKDRLHRLTTSPNTCAQVYSCLEKADSYFPILLL